MAMMTVSVLEGALVLSRTGLSTRPLDLAASELAALVAAQLPARDAQTGRRRSRPRAA